MRRCLFSDGTENDDLESRYRKGHSHCSLLMCNRNGKRHRRLRVAFPRDACMGTANRRANSVVGELSSVTSATIAKPLPPRLQLSACPFENKYIGKWSTHHVSSLVYKRNVDDIRIRRSFDCCRFHQFVPVKHNTFSNTSAP